MSEKTREQKRLDAFNTIFVGVQLGLCVATTYGDFLKHFELEMKRKIGDYTEEDELWAFKLLEEYENKNSTEPKNKSKKE